MQERYGWPVYSNKNVTWTGHSQLSKQIKFPISLFECFNTAEYVSKIANRVSFYLNLDLLDTVVVCLSTCFPYTGILYSCKPCALHRAPEMTEIEPLRSKSVFTLNFVSTHMYLQSFLAQGAKCD